MIHYDWFTHAVLDDGTQLVAIRPTLSEDRAATIVLTRNASNLLSTLLSAFANEPEVGWSAARQACLRSFYETARGDHTADANDARQP